MRSPQCRDNVDPAMDPVGDAGGGERGGGLARRAGEVDLPAAGLPQGASGGLRLGGIGIIGAAQAGERRAGGPPRGDERGGIGRSGRGLAWLGPQSRDAAGLEQAACETGPRREGRERTETGEEDTRWRTMAQRIGLRRVAQGLVGLGEAAGRQGFPRNVPAGAGVSASRVAPVRKAAT